MGKAKVRFGNLISWAPTILLLGDSGVVCGVPSASEQGRRRSLLEASGSLSTRQSPPGLSSS